MKQLNYLVLTIAFLISLSSCTMEKRHYQSGYYIDWKKNTQNTANQVTPREQLNNADAKSIHFSGNFSASSDAQLVLSNNEVAKKESEHPKCGFAETREHDQIKKHSLKEKVQVLKAIRQVKKVLPSKTTKQKSDNTPMLVLYILAFLLPPVAVGLATDWDPETTLINLGLTILCWLPGIVHALIVLGNRTRY